MPLSQLLESEDMTLAKQFALSDTDAADTTITLHLCLRVRVITFIFYNAIHLAYTNAAPVVVVAAAKTLPLFFLEYFANVYTV